MNKKAFTLIELLAVIVILAIIALIAAPIVINIINDSKTSSNEQSVELYIDSVKKAIARKQLKSSNFNPKICNIQNDGNLVCDNEKIVVDMKGIMPTKGIIEIKDNKITYKNLLLNGQYYNEIATLIKDNNNNGKPDIGDKYTYKVSNKNTFNFYVLSLNEDNTANLIMDRNICEDGTAATSLNICLYEWDEAHAGTSYGPITSMEKVYNATKEWNNVPNLSFEYNDNHTGYKSFVSVDGIAVITAENNTTTIIGTAQKPIKARTPTYLEVYSSGCMYKSPSNNHNGSCQKYLVDNMGNADLSEYVSNDKIEGVNSYWLMSNYVYNNPSWVLYVSNYGNLIVAGSSGLSGVRPVITVPIYYLEY